MNNPENKSVFNMTPCEIMTSMNPDDKDALYRLLWSDYVYDDVQQRLEDEYEHVTFENDDEREAFIENVVNRYVYDGDYDCNLTYWNNIDNIINDLLSDN